MRKIYISPHLDDAVLSCGGLIWEQTRKGTPVEIWTVCAGDAPPGELSMLVQVLHFQWGIKSAEEVLTVRKRENQDAADLLGAQVLNFSIPDCIYRRSPDGEILYPQDIFVPLHPSENKLAEEISIALASELLPGDSLVSPLTIGGHPDHLLTHQAVELLDFKPEYYSDIPYCINNPEHVGAAVVGLQKVIHPISSEALDAWIEAIAVYTSQISSLFETDEKMRASIRSYWERETGIPLWQHP